MGQIRRVQAVTQGAVIMARGFQHDEDGPSGQCGGPAGDGGGGVGKAQMTRLGIENVQMRLGDIDSDVIQM